MDERRSAKRHLFFLFGSFFSLIFIIIFRFRRCLRSVPVRGGSCFKLFGMMYASIKPCATVHLLCSFSFSLEQFYCGYYIHIIISIIAAKLLANSGRSICLFNIRGISAGGRDERDAEGGEMLSRSTAVAGIRSGKRAINKQNQNHKNVKKIEEEVKRSEPSSSPQ